MLWSPQPWCWQFISALKMSPLCSTTVPLPGCSGVFTKYLFQNPTPSLLTPVTGNELGVPILGYPLRGFWQLAKCFPPLCRLLNRWRIHLVPDNGSGEVKPSQVKISCKHGLKEGHIPLIDHDRNHLWGKSASFWIVFKPLVSWWMTDTEMLQNYEWYARSRCLCTLKLPLKTGFLTHSHQSPIPMLFPNSSTLKTKQASWECEQEYVEVQRGFGRPS